MKTLEAFIITFSIILIGLILLKSILIITELITHKKVSFTSLFFNFKQKMWMTIGIGTLFFSLYLFLLFFGAFKLNPQEKLALFFNAYQNPALYAYRGLGFFVSMTILSYVARMIIIFFYNSKKR